MTRKKKRLMGTLRPLRWALELSTEQPANLWRRAGRISPSARVLLSFVVLIGIGTALLMPRFAVADGQEPLGFVDALFTATSAVCVTGLSTIDVGVRLSFAGQAILLLLIQIGGLGFLTISTGLLLSLGGRSSMLSHAAVVDSVSAIGAAEVRGVLKNLFAATFLLEACGAVFLSWRFGFLEGYSPGKAWWYGIFHSVSAFCNAGFSLFSKAGGDGGDGLAAFSQDVFVNITIMALIVLGGLGFLVYHDIVKYVNSGEGARLALHSKIALAVSAVLVPGGAFLFYVFEYNGLFASGPWHEGILPSLFHSVSARTAGFNTVDIGALSSPALMLMMVLMFIGGCPASCAGGIKTTTAFIIFRLALARLAGRRHPSAFGREIGAENVARAATLILVALGILVTAAAALLVFHGSHKPHAPGGSFLDLTFEAVSALGTVGLSTGVTPEFGAASKLVLVAAMYVGRLGPLTVFVALARPPRSDRVRYPEEPIMVG